MLILEFEQSRNKFATSYKRMSQHYPAFKSLYVAQSFVLKRALIKRFRM